MKRFVELRFGQSDMGESLVHGKKGDELFVQRELIPVDAILDMFIVLPQKRNIQITWKVGKRQFCRTEYYKDTIDCIKRWTLLRKACGLKWQPNPAPLPMDVEDMKEWEEGGKDDE